MWPMYFPMLVPQLKFHNNNKNSVCEGQAPPSSIRIRSSHADRENPRTPAHPYIGVLLPVPFPRGRAGLTFHVLWRGGRRGDFFNPSLSIATGS